jgi:outer membrane receptor protein involved in Fe transport
VDTEGPAPVQIINRDAMERSGSNTLQDVLKRIPSNFAGVNENINNQGSTGGQGNISLRGLGAETTLVLVNGRRIAPSAAAGGTSVANINAIPLAAIERLEVLQDGASAIYGSDAIGGVVNIILRRDFTGSELTLRYGNTDKGHDNHEFRANVVTGASTDKASAVIVFDYFDRGAKLRQDFDNYTRVSDHRALHADGTDQRSPTGNPGTVYLRPGSAYFTATNPLGLPANPSGIFGIPDGSTGVWTDAATFARTLLPGVERTFEFSDPNQIIPYTNRIGLSSIASYKISDHIESFMELGYNQNKTIVVLAATPVIATGAANIVPANNPYNPFGEPVNFRFRPLDVGPRTNYLRTDNYRFLFGLKGDVGNNWNWEIGLLMNQDTNRDIGVNFIVTTDMIAAASGTFARAPGLFLNVFGDKQGNDPRLLRALNNTVTTNGTLKQQAVDAKVTGTIWELPAGGLGVAIGGEKRQERYEVYLDPLTQQGAFAGSGTRENTFGLRDVYSAYAEVSIPLVSPKQNFSWMRNAELQIAAREEEYNIRGQTKAKFTSKKPKYAISFRPIKDLLVRASYAEGFKAPTLFELFSGANGSFPSVNDPLRNRLDATITNPVLIQSLHYWLPSIPANAASVFLPGTGLAADDAQQVQQAQQGNTQLQPEESKSNYVGLVYDVKWVKGLSLSAGWFKIRHENIIRLPLVTTPNTGVLQDPGLQFLLRRDPQTAADIAANRPGRLATNGVAIFLQYVNRALEEVEGYDFEVDYKWKTANWGTFNHSLSGTYMAHYWDKGNAQATLTDTVGSAFAAGGNFTIPRVKMNLQNAWKYRNWTTSANVNFTGHYNEFSTPANDTRVVEHYVTVDLQTAYTLRTPWLGGNMQISAGVINAFDESTPYVTENVTGSGNTGFDAQVADPRGRFWYLQVRQTF